MKDPKIRLTSQPPLDDADIISLLALGVTSQQLERRQSGEQATDLGSAILSQNLAIKNNFFDVKISSTSAAEDTNVTDQKVTLSRQWGPRVSTSVGRTLRTNVTDAKLKYDLNENLAAILNWEGRQTSEESSLKQGTKTSSDVLGVGLEYGVEFK
jgi:translocation and assembly module TamB